MTYFTCEAHRQPPRLALNWRSHYAALCVLELAPLPGQVLTLAVDVYHLSFPKDSWQTKSTGRLVGCSLRNTCGNFDAVYGLYLLEIAQTVVVTNVAWNTLCVGWGNPRVLVHTSWGFAMIPAMNGMSEWCAKLLFPKSLDFSYFFWGLQLLVGWSYFLHGEFGHWERVPFGGWLPWLSSLYV